jgi:hypothetical protein
VFRRRCKSCRARGRRGEPFDKVVALLLEKVDAEQARDAAERRELCRLFGCRFASRRSHPERVDLAAEPLRGTPCAAEDPLRFRLWLDEDEQALGHGLLAELPERLDLPARFGVFCDLAQHELAQRGQVLVPEKVLERDLCSLFRVDLAGAQPCLQFFRVRSTMTTWSASSRMRSGKVSRTRTSVSSKIESLRLSRCWTLTVEMTSMPASRISSMSW